MTRREALKWAALAGSCRFLEARDPDIRFPAEPRQRLAVASYPFRQEHIPLTSFPAMVKERFDISNVEPLGDHFKSTAPGYVKELRSACDQAGVKVVNIPCSPQGMIYDSDQAKRATAIADSKRWVDVAVAVGSPSIRVHIRGQRGVTPDVERAADSLRQIAAYGEQQDVVINLENDDPHSEEGMFLIKVMERAGSPFLRALPDFCNSMLAGPPEYNYRVVAAMFSHAYNIAHVKDSEVDEGKVYSVDVDRTFGIAKAAGYRGYFSMEWEGKEDQYTGTKKLIERSLKNLS